MEETRIQQFSKAFETQLDKKNNTYSAGSSYVLTHGEYALKIMVVYADQSPGQMSDRFHTAIPAAFQQNRAQLKMSPVTSINYELHMLQTAEASGITPEVFEVSTMFLNDYVDYPYVYDMLKKLNVLTTSEKMIPMSFAPVYCVGILMENMYVNYKNDPDSSTANYGNAVAAALHLAVTSGIFHCDLKIDNWLIAKKTNLYEKPPIVLIDLGACYQLEDKSRKQLENDTKTETSFMQLFSVLCNGCKKNGVEMANTLCNVEGSTDVDGVVHPYYEQLDWHEIFAMFEGLKQYVKQPTTGHITFEAPDENTINEQNIPAPAAPAAAPAAPAAQGWGAWFRGKVSYAGKKTKNRKLKRRHSRKHTNI